MLMFLAASISVSSIVSLEWVVKLSDLFIFENILLNLMLENKNHRIVES